MADSWKLKLKQYKEPNADWQSTISGGYLNIEGKVNPMTRYRDPDYIRDTNGNPTKDTANNGYWKVTAELTGLINPFTVPGTTTVVKETKIEVAFEGSEAWGKMMDYNSFSKYLAASAAEMIEDRYKKIFGVEIKLSTIFVKGEEEPKPKVDPVVGTPSTVTTVTETKGTTASGTTASGTTASVASDTGAYGEFTFNVEEEFFFKGNIEFGTLEIIGKGIIKEEAEPTPPDEMPDGEVLDEEYTEEESIATEEQIFVPNLDQLDTSSINIETLNNIKGYDPENPDETLSTNSDAKYPISKNTDSNIKKIMEVAKKSGVTNKYSIAAMLAICKKESGFIPQNEASYGGTSAKRIKKIFSSMRKYSDSEVDRIKKNHKEFFDIIYGGNKEKGTLKYGNAWNEGYKYRGRGLNQITFKGNYEKYKKMSGYDIVGDPDLLNTIEVAAKCLVEYFKANIKEAPKAIEKKYNFEDINSFKNLDDAMGAFYHANAGWGNTDAEILADSTGGRKKAFNYVGPIYNTYLKEKGK